MHKRYHALKMKALSERGSMMARARWAKENQRRAEEEAAIAHDLALIRSMNLPRKEGDLLGTLQWTEHSTGKVRRWHIRIGDRADRITFENSHGVTSKSCGWTAFLSKLRRHLSTTT